MLLTLTGKRRIDFKCVAMFADIGLRTITQAAWFCIRCKRDVTSSIEPNSSELHSLDAYKTKTDSSVAVAVFVKILRIDARRRR